ncbi:MAG: PDGLE domain-containing protein, partial [Bryobacteraceae bacterium]
AVVGVLIAYLPYHFLGAGRFRNAAIFLGAAASVLASAYFALAQIAVSGVPMPASLVSISSTLFVISAVAEGAITLAVVKAIERIHPSWIRSPMRSNQRTVKVLCALAAFIAVGVLFASAYPDTLETAAERLGIASRSVSLLETPFADYEWTLFDSDWLRKASAGIAGLLIVYLICTSLGRMSKRKRSA